MNVILPDDCLIEIFHHLIKSYSIRFFQLLVISKNWTSLLVVRYPLKYSELYLSFTGISDVNLENLRNFKILNLSHTNINNSIIFHLANVNELVISGCEINKIPNIENIKKLEISCTTTIVSDLSKLVNVEELY